MPPRHPLSWLPWGLVVFRALMAPVLFIDATDGDIGAAFLLGLSAAFISDILDGMIARRIGVASQALRRTDSVLDVVFLLLMVASAWILYPETLRPYAYYFVIAWGLLALGQVVALLKYKRLTAYHLYSSKLGGVVFFLAGLSLFTLGRASWLLDAALGLMVLSQLESLYLTLRLKHWISDVPGFWAFPQNHKKNI